MSAGLARLSRLPAQLLTLLVRAYQLLLSPLFAGSCRFYPSCSAYAVQALHGHGAVRGTWLTLRRLSRCHPWNPGGVDEVPQSRRGATVSPPPGDGAAAPPHRIDDRADDSATAV